MKTPNTLSQPHAVILAIAEIKAATDAFDRGETNAHDAMDAIVVAVEGYRAAVERRRDAA